MGIWIPLLPFQLWKARCRAKVMQSLAVQRKLYQSFQSLVLLLTGRNEDDLYKASLRHPVRCTAFGSFTLSLLILVKNSCQEQADPGYGHSPKRKVCLHTQHTQACMYFQGTKCKRAVKAALNSRVPKASFREWAQQCYSALHLLPQPLFILQSGAYKRFGKMELWEHISLLLWHRAIWLNLMNVCPQHLFLTQLLALL